MVEAVWTPVTEQEVALVAPVRRSGYALADVYGCAKPGLFAA